ncbi:AzlC family ABC transporter permease [Mycolicibacterium mengxianglii]|uniref:AzlC family ABC transporter permease n=1 Tax=Mycolicibacterium mengxianglii TaxID=2736649 RepID=UPI0018D17B27|nr:AzlC family ABC transporter permease [Mycolicibacterium mengxianglii]
MLPILIGIAPFACVAGLAGTQNGFSVIETAAFSLFAFAGAAQIAALELIGKGAAAGVVIATALIINLRFIIYSATLAPMFVRASWRQRVLGSYLLVDHAVALTLSRTVPTAPNRQRLAFYFGACVAFWSTWQICSLIGSFLGSLPKGGLIAFAVPVSFIALLAPQLTERPKVCAAVVAAVVATACAGFPANLGMMLGTSAGLASGVALGWRKAGKEASP